MKSSVIPKEEANKYKIENYYGSLQSTSEPNLVDKILEIDESISDEEKLKVEKILETFFLYRNPGLELSRKFRDFFEKELEKSRQLTPSQKFVDFLISRKISGDYRRKEGNVVDSTELKTTQYLDLQALNVEEGSQFPKVLRNESGEITAIEVQCKCGEIIHIDIEFE
ncbi:MAG: hypothetical protein ACPLX7_02610 [Candidatus Kapaibacteriota bacterium]|jgi:hypothetical protein